MSGGRFFRVSTGARGLAALLWTCALVAAVAPSASAFEAFDGRLQAHGYFESTMRSLNADFSEDWDVAQWYMIFNLEVEMDLLRDTVGPFDLLSAFVRAEVRYDCIYSSGCGLFRSINAFGDGSKSLPRRLQNARRYRHAGRIRIPNDPELPVRYSGSDTDPLDAFEDPTLILFSEGAGGDGIGPGDPCDQGQACPYLAGGDGVTMTGPIPVTEADGSSIPSDPMDPLTAILQGVPIADVWFANDNPYPALAHAGGFEDFRFIAPGSHTGAPGSGGPWLPKNEFVTNATLANAPNPFDDRVGSYSLVASAYNGYTLAGQTYIDSPDTDPAFSREDKINQVYYAATRGEDANLDGKVLASEDVNDNGLLDAGEDTNGNGFLDFFEDLNNSGDANASALLTKGSGELPYRAVPVFREDNFTSGAGISATRAGDPRGLFLPSRPLADLLNEGNFDEVGPSYNFSEQQRAWNRGASQRDEKELKEAYLDIETLDNRLWMRVGKQQVVWGKTELFRTTDQFNPTDAALASLPSLEESRIALWSFRGVYSFYEVGPVDDVRFEVALNFDDYQQTDLGACGEAYTPDLVCGLTFGSFAHGIFGVGLAGIEKPPSPWQSLEGLEGGARLEWRWDRFSFALMDFYGFADLPYIKQISTYTRNVDPLSGRPRQMVPGTLERIELSERSDIAMLAANAGQTVPDYLANAGVGSLGTQPNCLTGMEAACLNPKEDLNQNGVLDFVNEDVNGDLMLTTEDLNGNGILDVPEDVNMNGMLDPGEDTNGNGVLDTLNEDANMNGMLDLGEDLNGNGLLDFAEDLDGNGALDFEALTDAAVSNQLFAFTCAGTVGFSASLDPTACALNIFGSQEEVLAGVSTAQGIGAILAGSGNVNFALTYAADMNGVYRPSPIKEDLPVDPVACAMDPENCDGNGVLDPGEDLNNNGELDSGGHGGFILPLVKLSADPGDLDNPPVNGQTHDCIDTNVGAFPTGSKSCGGAGAGLIQSLSGFAATVEGLGNVAEGLGNTLSPEQEALLGCGPFWGTQCDDSGVDLLNAEGSALFMSWPGVEGTEEGTDGAVPSDITRIWKTNEKTRDSSGRLVFADQPGTRAWYFDPDDGGVTHRHRIGPVCTTANFGGAIYADVSDAEGGNDYANGNQDVLPGCRRKWKGAPVAPDAFGNLNISDSLVRTSWDAGPQRGSGGAPGVPDGVIDTDLRPNLLRLNLYGVDARCARMINDLPDGDVRGTGCQYLVEYVTGSNPNAAPKDPRSWNRAKDGDPDGTYLDDPDRPAHQLGVYGLASLFDFNNPGRIRPAEGAPDFFYTPNADNPYPFFDDCNANFYPQIFIEQAGGAQFVPCGKGGHPLTGQPWASEIAAASWNFMVLLVDQDLSAGRLLEVRDQFERCPGNVPNAIPGCKTDYQITEMVYMDDSGDYCSLVTTELCPTLRTLMGSIGIQRNIRRAGGNGQHGRRTMVWQSGGEAVLAYEKRNVLGFSMDFAEDRTKANFSMEFTWIEGQPVTNNQEYSGLTKVDNYNLTLSVDRPTFINFLNSNRTFFFNGQMFMGYTDGWKKGMTAEGPWSFLGTLAVGTGYFQDRLIPSLVSVYDFKTQSGAMLAGLSYRFTQNFSAAVGMAFFYGKADFVDEPVAGLAPASNRPYADYDHLYSSGREGGLAIVRNRDELWARVRYTF